MLMLASASKARKNLLEKACIPHLVMSSDIDEGSFKTCDVEKLVKNLAFAKAKAVASKICDSESNSSVRVVLGCDSVFVFQGEIYGKPRNQKEAIERWKRMSSNFGFLYTGHALLFESSNFVGQIDEALERSSQAVIRSRVEFAELDDGEIIRYVESGEPLNSAGGFTLEGRGGMFIRRIEGCYSNIIGLSLPWLRTALNRSAFNSP